VGFRAAGARKLIGGLLRHRAGRTYRGDGEGAEGIEAGDSKTNPLSSEPKPAKAATPERAARRKNEALRILIAKGIDGES